MKDICKTKLEQVATLLEACSKEIVDVMDIEKIADGDRLGKHFHRIRRSLNGLAKYTRKSKQL